MIFLDAAALIWRNPEVVTRNPSGVTQGARDAYDTAKSMRAYRDRHKAAKTYFCRYCGDSGSIHIHHIHPVSVAPEKAASEANFILLCADCHFRVAHAGRWTDYVANVDDLCRIRRLTVTR